jgi:MATE family multidrug resistance protein
LTQICGAGFAFDTCGLTQGARPDDIVLAANAVLFNLLMLVTYLLDGFAFSVETLAGQSAGARSLTRFREAVRLSSIWAVGCSVIMSAAIWVGGGWGIDLLTVNEEVRATARIYLVWAAVAPVLGIACFQFDGIYIGVTRTADMRNMMIISTAVYLAAWWALTAEYGNHGLWAALMVFFVVRALTLGWRYPAMVRATFP